MSSLPSYVAAAKPVPAASRGVVQKCRPHLRGHHALVRLLENYCDRRRRRKPRREFCLRGWDGLGGW